MENVGLEILSYVPNSFTIALISVVLPLPTCPLKITTLFLNFFKSLLAT